MIKTILVKDPTRTALANQGVAKVSEDRAMADTLRAELETFVCQGEYQAGLSNILDAFLRNHASGAEQAGVWISGFFGSGKSHLAKMLRHLWTNHGFRDGATARGVANLPQALQDEFKQLDAAGKRAGGLHAAAGTLNSAANAHVRMAVMGIVFRSLELPEAWHQASFVNWLREQELEEQLKARIGAQEWEQELENLYVGQIPRVLAELRPDLGATAPDVRKVLREQFPQKSDLSNQELVDMVGRVLRLRFQGKIPLTVIVLDEVQQHIGTDPHRAMMVQETVEALMGRFKDRLLLVGTGQSALRDTPSLQKLMGRFPIGVQLSETDVDAVLRKVLLAKTPEALPMVQELVTRCQGELAHQLQDSAVGWRATDRELAPHDYPLVPSRRRFWDALLRSVDTTGTGAQLRSQLHTVHATLAHCAQEEMGYIVPGDALYDHLASNLLMTSVLPRPTYEDIQRLGAGTDEEKLQARILKLVFLLQQIPEGTNHGRGLVAAEPVLLDLLVSRLEGERQDLSIRVKSALESMVRVNRLQKLPNGVYALQTPEGLAWTNEFDRQKAEFGQNPSWQDADIRTRLQEEWASQAGRIASINHGESQVPRPVRLSFDPTRPSDKELSVWVRTSRDTSWEALELEAKAAGTQCPVTFVFVPMTGEDRLVQHLLEHKAAQRALDVRGTSHTKEGSDARSAMTNRAAGSLAMGRTMLRECLAQARVLTGGGAELTAGFLKERIQESLLRALPVLYPEFPAIDHPSWGKVWERASKGQPDALQAVGYHGEPDQHPACRQVLHFVGTHGKTGREVRERYTQSPYGWPPDALDGILAALAVAGKLKVMDPSRRSVAAGAWDRKAIGAYLFQSEQVTLTASEKIKLKGLLQKWNGKVSEAGQEEAGVREHVRRLLDLGRQAGGTAPLPTAAFSELLESLEQESGNTLLQRALEEAAALETLEAKWQELVARRQEREPRWQRLHDLLAAGAGLLPLEELRTQAQAVLQARTLLVDPDPVAPLLDAAADHLRKAIHGHGVRLQAVFQAEQAKLEALPEWQKLSEQERKAFLEREGLLHLEAPDLSDDEAVLLTLQRRSLGAWKDFEEALPLRFGRLREAVIQKFQPKAQAVTLPKRTVTSEAELEEWWLETRGQILDALKKGPVIL